MHWSTFSENVQSSLFSGNGFSTIKHQAQNAITHALLEVTIQVHENPIKFSTKDIKNLKVHFETEIIQFGIPSMNEISQSLLLFTL